MQYTHIKNVSVRHVPLYPWFNVLRAVVTSPSNFHSAVAMSRVYGWIEKMPKRVSIEAILISHSKISIEILL